MNDMVTHSFPDPPVQQQLDESKYDGRQDGCDSSFHDFIPFEI